MKRRFLILALSAGLALLGAAWGVASLYPSRSGETVSPSRYAVSSRPLVRRDQFTEPRAILDDIVSRYGGSAIIGTSFGGPTPGWTGTEDPSMPVPKKLKEGRWLYTTVSAPAAEAYSTTRPLWEANLVAGALRDELHLAGVRGDLIASNVSVRLPNGRVLKWIGGGMGNIEFGQSFADAADSSIEANIRAAAKDLGLQVHSVTVLHPLQAAPAVVVITKEPRQFVDFVDAIVTKLFGGTATYEGEYVEAIDTSGAPVLIEATDFRTGVGQRWIRPDLDPRQQSR